MRNLLFLLPLFLLAACVHEPQPAPVAEVDDEYPDHIQKILLTRCGVTCHNAASYQDQGGLRMYTWDYLFHGARNGAAIVPYDVENSPLLHFINVDHTLGHVASPTMPFNPEDPSKPINPLTREEYLAVREWVAAGAPNKKGEVPFASDADGRQKIYCAMQGCDLLGVIDAERRVVMRYIRVGKSPGIESPHCVRVSPDGKYAYVSFINSDWVQKINTRTDEIEDEINLGTTSPNGAWNVLHLSPDGQRFVITDWNKGEVMVVKTADMTIEQHYSGSDLFSHPHGVAAVPTFDTFYITAEYGNTVYKISPNGGLNKKISIDGDAPHYKTLTRDPHEIIFSPDRSKYFVTCQASDEVRVLDAKTDAVLAAIKVGTRPREMDISRSKPYLFVTCEEDGNSLPLMRGSVYVIDYNTLQVVKEIKNGPFSQPHGITVDDRSGTFYVASRNATASGPAPHHAASCTGRNGWYNVYSLATLEPATTQRFEVSVEPYSMDVRFKN